MVSWMSGRCLARRARRTRVQTYGGGKVLEPLWSAGWIELNNSLYGLTPSGLDKLQALEDINPAVGFGGSAGGDEDAAVCGPGGAWAV